MLNKTAILPIISLAALLLKNWFHVELGAELQDNIVDGILTLVTLYGVYKDHTKKPS